MKNKIFLSVIISFCLSFFVGCSSDNNNSSSGGGGGGNPVGFQALLGDTFTNLRCTNCHGFDGGNAVAVNHDAAGRSDDCASCHGDAVPTWRAPFRSFSFNGLSTSQICTAIKNKTANDISILREHMLGSPHIQWAVASGALPGGGSVPPAPPGSVGGWAALVNMWIDNGAICD